jgi:hypothetical protein
MALLPYVDESKASDKTREILGNTPRKLNVARMIANASDAVFQNFSRLGNSDYVETQARDEKVVHAEKVKTEHILGRDYNCWDVHTDKDRYWVITSPSNLYSQHYFPSLDFTISFHIGVTARVMARSRGAPDDAQRARLTPAWRRWEQAAETLDMAEEAEDFQAVGTKCR